MSTKYYACTFGAFVRHASLDEPSASMPSELLYYFLEASYKWLSELLRYMILRTQSILCSKQVLITRVAGTMKDSRC